MLSSSDYAGPQGSAKGFSIMWKNLWKRGFHDILKGKTGGDKKEDWSEKYFPSSFGGRFIADFFCIWHISGKRRGYSLWGNIIYVCGDSGASSGENGTGAVGRKVDSPVVRGEGGRKSGGYDNLVGQRRKDSA